MMQDHDPIKPHPDVERAETVDDIIRACFMALLVLILGLLTWSVLEYAFNAPSHEVGPMFHVKREIRL